MINSQLLQYAVSHQGFRPLSGRCVIKLDETPTMAGLLHIPDSARGLRAISEVKGGSVYGDTAYMGEVLAMTPRKNKSGEWKEEQFKTGDKVWVMLLMKDLDEQIICTRVERVYAVLEQSDQQTYCAHCHMSFDGMQNRCQKCGNPIVAHMRNVRAFMESLATS